MSAGGLVVVPQLLGRDAVGAAVSAPERRPRLRLRGGREPEPAARHRDLPGPAAGAQVPFGTVVVMTVSTRLIRPPNDEPQIQPGSTPSSSRRYG